MLYSEIGRILSHLLNVTTQAMDVGALTPPLWGFEPREDLMIFGRVWVGRQARIGSTGTIRWNTCGIAEFAVKLGVGINEMLWQRRAIASK